jgi:hypothetical protein
LATGNLSLVVAYGNSAPDEFTDVFVQQRTDAIELLKVLFERLRRADRRIR